jgi:hypothetical protein
MSTLSLFCVFLFICIKFNAAWSRKRYLKFLTAAWIALELLALTIFALGTNEKIKLSWFPVDSMYGVLMTLSLWGTATLQVSQESVACDALVLRQCFIQVIAVIYPLGIDSPLGMWVKYAVIAECIEVLIIVTLIFLPQVTVYVEIVYIVTPFTSQVTTMGIMYYASRRIRGQSASRRTVIHFMWVGLAVLVISTVLVVLSATGVYRSLALMHGLLYTESSIMGLRSAREVRPSPPSADGRSGIPLTSNGLLDSNSSLTHGISRPTSSYTRSTLHYCPC